MGKKREAFPFSKLDMLPSTGECWCATYLPAQSTF